MCAVLLPASYRARLLAREMGLNPLMTGTLYLERVLAGMYEQGLQDPKPILIEIAKEKQITLQRVRCNIRYAIKEGSGAMSDRVRPYFDDSKKLPRTDHLLAELAMAMYSFPADAET